MARAFAAANDWSRANVHVWALCRMIEWARELEIEDVDEAADAVEDEMGWDAANREDFLAAFPAPLDL